jgi:hypothetical protein
MAVGRYHGDFGAARDETELIEPYVVVGREAVRQDLAAET